MTRRSKKVGDFVCKKCGKKTSTTNQEAFQTGLCGECRGSRLMHKKYKKMGPAKTGLTHNEKRLYKLVRTNAPITYRFLAQKSGYNQDSIRSLVSAIRRKGYDIDNYIQKGGTNDMKKMIHFRCKNCGKETTTTNLNRSRTGLCTKCKKAAEVEGLNPEEMQKEMNETNIRIKDSKISIGLDDGMELNVPIKTQMTAEEFLNISEKIKNIKNLSAGPIKQEAEKIGEGTKDGGYGWGENEIQYLISNYRKTPVYKIATKLGRTADSVVKKASRLGLKKIETSKDLKSWTKEETEFLKKNAENMTIDQLAAELNRKITSIAGKLYRINLSAKYKKTFKRGKNRIKNSDVLNVIRKLNERGIKPNAKTIRIEMGLTTKFKPSIFAHIWKLEKDQSIKRDGAGYVTSETKANKQKEQTGIKNGLKMIAEDEQKQEMIKCLLQDCIDGKKIVFKDARMIGLAETPEEWQIISKKIINNEDKICTFFKINGKFIFTSDFCLIFTKEG